MMTYSEQQREAPVDAEPMTPAEWAAYQLDLDRENQPMPHRHQCEHCGRQNRCRAEDDWMACSRCGYVIPCGSPA